MLAIRQYLFQKINYDFVPLWLIALSFSLPISSSGKSIFTALAAATILLSAEYRQSLTSLLSKTWCKWAFFLFFLAIAGCLWSPANSAEKWFVIEKYSKLLYLPVLVAGFKHDRTRSLALHAFMAAMLITSLLSIIKFSGWFDFYTQAIHEDFVFRNRIMTSLMMTFATYLAGFFFLKKQGKFRYFYLFTGLIYSYQILFISGSRTGYIIYLFLMSSLMIQLLGRRQALLAIVGIWALFAVSFHHSLFLHSGLARIVSELQHFKEDKNTSLGYRLQFHEFAYDLFKRHPLIGNGTGSFSYTFKMEQPITAWGNKLLDPHSQYWLVLSEWGLMGIAALIGFFASLFAASFQLKVFKPVALAILMIFCLGNLSDTLLFYSGSGYFFLLLIALCLGEEEQSQECSLGT